MIVNCFNVFSSVRISRDRSESSVSWAKCVSKVASAIYDLYYGDDEFVTDRQYVLSDVETILFWDSLPEYVGEMNSFTPLRLTGSEQRLVLSIAAWLRAPLYTNYVDAWDQKSLATPMFVMENHNRAMGIMLHRSV